MKKIAIFLLVLLTSIAAQATDLTGVKIYINPGHGGYDANDRSVWTIPVPEEWTNPNGFWESKSNLVKALALKEMLEAAGATVIISRTDNTSGVRDQSYHPGVNLTGGGDRDLSEIAEEANANNVDHFISIHSNAMGTANSLTNHLLFLYHGDDGVPTVAESLPMAQSAGPIQQNNPLTVWQNTAASIRGDFTFYGDRVGLGVLRPLTVPGFLSEGSFHDYAPETHRLCNNDYCKLEALRMFKHFHAYFHRDMPAAATVAGWVKSENERVDVLEQPKFVFRAATDDQWKPINGAKVTLLDESGQNTLQTYTTDGWYNGIYAFYNLAAGNYKVRVEATGYESKTVDVTAIASEIAYAKVKLFNPDYALNSNLEPDYPQPNQDAGAVALDHYNFLQQGETTAFDALNSAAVKRMLFRNNKIYVLTTEPKILVYDAATQASLGELNLTGVEGGDAILSDIAFAADGKLLACNRATILLVGATTSFKVYKWDNDNATPDLLFQSQKQANWNEGLVGETFATAGASDHLKVYTTAVTTGSSKQIRIIGFEYLAATNMLADKYMGSADVAHNGTATYTEAEWGAHLKFTISPSGSGDHFIIDSDIMQATEYQFDWEQPDRFPLTPKGIFSATETPAVAQGNAFARYAGHVFMAAPVCNADASGVGVALYDVTAGLDNADKISETYPESGLGTTPAGAMLAGIVVNGYDIELTIIAQNQGIARYKTENNPVANIYASELSYAAGKFNFTLNEDAVSVVIEIYNEGEFVQTYEAVVLAKGVHSIDNPFGAATFDSYGITATARPNVALSKVSGDSPVFQFYSARGVAVDNTPTSPYFGRIYVTETAGGQVTVGTPPDARVTQRGIYILNAAHEDVTGQGVNSYNGGISWATNSTTGYQYGPLHPTVAPDGKLYISDSSYGNSGVYILNPANPAANFKPVFGGTRDASNGQSSENGVTIHNPVQNCYVMGTGANTQLYTLDRTAVPVTGKIQRYDIGELTTPWTAAPSATIFSDPNNRMQNSYGTIAYDSHGGWWLAQYRAGAGGTSVPTLIHATNNVEDYNVEAAWPSGYQGVVAVSIDGSTLALGTEPGKAQVFEVTYDASNKPTLTPTFNIEWGGTASYVQGAAFDVAGNLYLVSNGNERLMIYSFPNADNSYTTRVSVAKGTGINAPESKANVRVYPNPVISGLVIDGQGVNLKAYTLYDLNGRAIRSEKIENGDRYTVSVGGLNAGIYILQVQTPEGVVVKRIIKK
ncbi:MAG: T9SS type A sorting domain-containing protein [Dysgonamonadaceae bacterium]|jgi:N-acetylmuramoyl-L-alanine amidase|nr:T9SS type A sorting domain-containing protein [Dysgonamonadaceae bacterium]